MARKRNDLSAIRAQFPSITELDWERVFREDNELYGRIWKDILKFDQAGEGRPGPRPALDREQAHHRYLQLTGEDYTFEPFKEAFKNLVGNLSIRKVAERTGLDRNLIARLLTGDVEPDNYEMQIVATAFSKRPSYFLEYRIGFVLMMVHSHMLKYPESSVGPYVKVRDRLGKAP